MQQNTQIHINKFKMKNLRIIHRNLFKWNTVTNEGINSILCILLRNRFITYVLKNDANSIWKKNNSEKNSIKKLQNLNHRFLSQLWNIKYIFAVGSFSYLCYKSLNYDQSKDFPPRIMLINPKIIYTRR